ncbi:MAG: carbamoyltransferase HypF [Humidesulfovibrio sp.]|uniref:carbamoyltransferase HypF n=1 Tax=Humidesulfovibrio sp. TaxID=2910988 RepID=UPI0027FAE841|nr:carbamoyltransferase HypF [Humidesulfovibrio sp.]MDQ7834005.1 carbamoyltransferase HypF [Humidesulfovibrio sp.]
MSDISPRRRITVTGQVQGVGFRPYIYRLAQDVGLAGMVRNAPEGVIIEIQGSPRRLDEFLRRLEPEQPPLSRIMRVTTQEVAPMAGANTFEILKSTGGTGHDVLISPDISTCADCLADLTDKTNRRFLYPFTNCTNCGPRFTITRSIPYDRPNTSMGCFPLCPDCKREYDDPANRRFHAQPNACPVCGPKVWLSDRSGMVVARRDEAMRKLAAILMQGGIAAVKGLGGFHLACDATSQEAVRELRLRKKRPHKPLAVMVPDLETARQLAEIGPAEEAWLTGHVRPIVLCPKRRGAPLAESVAPEADQVGIMLPYTPLHHVLFRRYSRLLQQERQNMPAALVMTSGNVSDEPICLGNREALCRLAEIADIFMFHNRDILIRTDDSVLRVPPDSDQAMLLRRARGFAPQPVFLPESGPSVLGLGPELKCTLTLTKGDKAFVSQHLGDMQNIETLGFHHEISEHFQDILQTEPVLAVRDQHPNFLTTSVAQEMARKTGIETIFLQHHFAHAHAVLAENKFHGPAICLALDGTGFGPNQPNLGLAAGWSIWGGECLLVDTNDLRHSRLGHLAEFSLPGGETAVHEPWRLAQSLLWELDIEQSGQNDTPAWPWLPQHEQASHFLPQLLRKSLNCPLTSSCGRLFDAVSAMLGLCLHTTYEGQAAIVLEQAQDLSIPFAEAVVYPCPVLKPTCTGRLGGNDAPRELDIYTMFRTLLEDMQAGTPVPVIARRFHASLITGLADMAARFAKRENTSHVALSGGVMQNLTFAVELPRAIAQRGLTPLTHKDLPPNDGCVSLGQAAYGQRLLNLRKERGQ